METLPWIAAHWFDLFQTAGIVGGLIFTAVTVRRDERARAIGNLLAIKQEYREIWQGPFERPSLLRVLQQDVDLARNPVTEEETIFVKQLLLHLDTVHRAEQAEVFVEIQGLEKDIRNFLSLPIPKAVWSKLKPFQDKNFVRFIDDASQ